MREQFDVVIVGGAVVGSAVAYFLARELGRAASIVVLERDPSYRLCATTRSVASIRHQFSTPENIRMSMFGSEFLRAAPQCLAHDGVQALIGFQERGYLFLASAEGLPMLQASHRAQRAAGADVAMLDAAALAQRFPWLATDDVEAGSLGLSGEGWLDAHGLMHALRRRAIALGVRYRVADAAALECEAGPPRCVRSVRLADDSAVGCGQVVNAAGIGATALARTAGIGLPVHPRKRFVFHFRSPATADHCPLVVDPSGLYFRPEGEGFLCGIAPTEDEDTDSIDFEVPHDWWEERLWPLLARRVPGFESARLLSAWAGHYDVNTLDHNPILGPHPELPNLLFANGFSGHGLQHAPAVGRAIAELIVFGGYRSLDLSALGWERVIASRPLRELAVV